MTNEEYISLNKDKDVRSLALQKVPEGVDLPWCLRQIEGWQTALRKLPRWASVDNLWYPPRISMEQCSSEATAEYKASLAGRLAGDSLRCMADITGGFGVDFSYMARSFQQCHYIERQEVLCETAAHNMPLLGLSHVHVINAEAEAALADIPFCDVIFADPARRDINGRKTVAIEDCQPDIVQLQDTIAAHCRYLIVKLSPMLDITQALRSIRNVAEVHIVSLKGECKELLFVIDCQNIEVGSSTVFYCLNLDTPDEPFSCVRSADRRIDISSPAVGHYLMEPNASILKAGVQEEFASHYALGKVHPHSNLYVSSSPPVPGIPARSFVIEAIYGFSKDDLKRLRKNYPNANITIRNFPSTVAELRKRLKIKDGGSTYLFVTTLADSTHSILVCRKA